MKNENKIGTGKVVVEKSEHDLENAVWAQVQMRDLAKCEDHKQSQLDLIIKSSDDKVTQMHDFISSIAHKLTARERYELEQGFLVCKSYVNQIARDFNSSN